MFDSPLPQAQPPTSFLCRMLDVLKLMWISWFHSGGCQLPTVSPNSFRRYIDSSTMCQINSLPVEKAVKWLPWHFEFLSFFFASHLSICGGNDFLHCVLWTRTKLISIPLWACMFTRKLMSLLFIHNTFHSSLTHGSTVSCKKNIIIGSQER